MAECREGPTGVILGREAPRSITVLQVLAKPYRRPKSGWRGYVLIDPRQCTGAVNNTGAYRRGYVTEWFQDDWFHRCRNDQDHDGVWDEARGTQ